MPLFEYRGDPDHHEGALLAIQREACVLTMALQVDDVSSNEASGRLQPAAASRWEFSRREFANDLDARQWLEALAASSSRVVERDDASEPELAARIESHLEQKSPKRRIARWAFVSPGQPPPLLASRPSTIIRIGGLAQWLQPRLVPREPDSELPMVCLAQFSGAIDPALPGDESTRFFVFGPALSEGSLARYTLTWQQPSVSTGSYACMVRSDENEEFAIVTTDMILKDPEERTSAAPDPFVEVAVVWRGAKGQVGHLEIHPTDGGAISLEQEFIATVRGLEDEGFTLAETSDLKSSWLLESLSRATRMAGQPATIDAQTFLHGNDHELRRLFRGYELTTDTDWNPVADDLIARAFPGIGGEPLTLDGPLAASDASGADMIPILQFDEDGPLDHPHVVYGDQGLVTVFVPSEPVEVPSGLVILQSF